jgi:hypothetical protein
MGEEVPGAGLNTPKGSPMTIERGGHVASPFVFGFLLFIWFLN